MTDDEIFVEFKKQVNEWIDCYGHHQSFNEKYGKKTSIIIEDFWSECRALMESIEDNKMQILKRYFTRWRRSRND